MKLNIENNKQVSPYAALFFEKQNLLITEGLSLEAQTNAKSIIQNIEEGVFDNSEIHSIDSVETIFVQLKGRGLSPLDKLRVAAYKLAKKLKQRKLDSIGIDLSKASAAEARSIFHGLYAAEYQFDRYKSKKSTPIDIQYQIDAKDKTKDFIRIAKEVEIEQSSIVLTKNWINTPSGDFTPFTFMQEAHKVADEAELDIKVRDFEALKAESFNGLVTVGKGSPSKPYLVTLEYKPENAKANTHLVLVGKGLTFDTGGVSLKPATGMWEMCCDMSGAAAVLGAIRSIALLKLPIRVSAVLCLAENKIGSNAVLPGDIFTAKNGKTVMVDNTDAEGRLALSDGLAEAELLKATHIVDLATLTGAMVRALGYAITGFFSNDSDLASKLKDAGEASCEKLWQLPLEEEYADGLQGKFADLQNIGADAGAISAALFLKEFVPENTAWSHLDIAGTAFTTKEWKYTSYGATGIGVQTLTELARQLGE